MANVCKITILVFLGGVILFLFGIDRLQNGEIGIENWNKNSLISSHVAVNGNATSNFAIKDVRVLCWVMTQPANHKSKAVHVKETWGKRCDTLIFVSSQIDTELPTVAVVSGKESRQLLWSKTKGAVALIYEKYLDKADWFLKADDDTYIIMENLKYFLKDYDTNEPLFFGQNDANQLQSQPVTIKGFMGGGAGYVLSKEALKLLVEKALSGNLDKCTKDVVSQVAEDLNISNCLAQVGVKFVDTRDKSGVKRFSFLNIDKILAGAGASYGFKCCSDELISLHYVDPLQMDVLEFLIYRLKVFEVVKRE